LGYPRRAANTQQWHSPRSIRLSKCHPRPCNWAIGLCNSKCYVSVVGRVQRQGAQFGSGLPTQTAPYKSGPITGLGIEALDDLQRLLIFHTTLSAVRFSD